MQDVVRAHEGYPYVADGRGKGDVIYGIDMYVYDPFLRYLIFDFFGFTR